MGFPTGALTAQNNPFARQPVGGATTPTASVAKPPTTVMPGATQPKGPQNKSFSPPAPAAAPANNTGEFDVPGAAENYWTQNAKSFAAPSSAESFWNQIRGNYGTPTASQQTFQGYNPAPTDLNGYYDNAQKNVESAMNGQLAATGHYGSSAGAGLVGQAVGNLRADQAQHEAGYDLQQQGLRGQLAGQADAAQTARTNQYANVAGSSTDALMQRLLGGGQLASTAQGMQANRGQNMFNNILAGTTLGENVVGGGLNTLLGQDSDILTAINNGRMGIGAEGQGVAQRNTELAGLNAAQNNQLTSTILSGLQQYQNAQRQGQNSFTSQPPVQR